MARVSFSVECRIKPDGSHEPAPDNDHLCRLCGARGMSRIYRPVELTHDVTVGKDRYEAGVVAEAIAQVGGELLVAFTWSNLAFVPSGAVRFR